MEWILSSESPLWLHIVKENASSHFRVIRSYMILNVKAPLKRKARTEALLARIKKDCVSSNGWKLWFIGSYSNGTKQRPFAFR